MNFTAKTAVVAALLMLLSSGVAVSDESALVGRVCRAAVAVMMGRDVAILKLDKVEGDIAYVSYVRPDDGKKWKNRCKLDGTRVLWSTVDLDGPGSGPGRWRDDPADEVISYSVSGDSITITQTFGDGSDMSDTVTAP